MAMLLHAINQAALVKSTDLYEFMPSSAAAFRFLGAGKRDSLFAVECSRLPVFGSICPGMDGIRAMQEQLPRQERLLKPGYSCNMRVRADTRSLLARVSNSSRGATFPELIERFALGRTVLNLGIR